jgi:fatty acid-binding protein DegV
MAAYADVEIRKRFDPALLITNDFSPVLGVHVGPGAIGIAHLGED